MISPFALEPMPSRRSSMDSAGSVKQRDLDPAKAPAGDGRPAADSASSVPSLPSARSHGQQRQL